MSMHPRLPRLRPAIAAAALAALLALVSGCARQDEADDGGARAATSLEGGRLVVVGAVPQFPPDLIPRNEGFIEDVRWDEGIATLQCRGWAPFDLRAESVRFVLRDPFDRLQLVGTPIVSPYERPDVAAAHPDRPELRHAGFTASIQLANVPASRRWPETLEFYCLEDKDTAFRLSSVLAPSRQSWSRAQDRFTVAISYATPTLQTPEGTTGSLDVCETLPDDSLHLTGWAPFDGASPRATLIIQLAPRLAPASIRVANMLPRPDVRAAVDPDRGSLERSGFELILQINGRLRDLKKRGALRLWAIETDGSVVEVGLPALR